MLPANLIRWFPAEIQARGEGYVTSGAVQIVRAFEHRILAVARGTATYTVDLSARSGALLLACTCPYAADYGYCKHLWALLRVTDRDRSLSKLLDIAGPRAKYRFEVSAVPDDVDDDDPDLYIEEDEFEDDDFGDDLIDDIDDDDADDPPDIQTPPVGRLTPQPFAPPGKLQRPAWWHVVNQACWEQEAQRASKAVSSRGESWPDDRRLVYLVDFDASTTIAGLRVDLGTERRDRAGAWGTAKRFQYAAAVWFNAPDAVDRQIAEMLLGATDLRGAVGMPTGGFVVRQRAFDTTLRLICDTGRARVRSKRAEVNGRVLRWENGPPWRLRLRISRTSNDNCALVGEVCRGDESLAVTVPEWVQAEGLMLRGDTLCRLDADGAFALLVALRETPSIPLGPDPSDFLEQLHRLSHAPELALPDGESLSTVDDPPIPSLVVTRAVASWRSAPPALTLRFQYGNVSVDADSVAGTVFDRAAQVVRTRDPAFEKGARARLLTLGAREEWSYGNRGHILTIAAAQLVPLVRRLVGEGWRVDADGVSYKTAGGIRAQVRSGVDWFDLSGSVQYGDVEVPLTTVLEARERHGGLVQLGDGVMGFVPVEALDRMGVLFATGTRVDGAIRFRRSQLALLDALLAALPEVDTDESLQRVRGELASFQRIAAAEVPAGFRGTLRPYQAEALGWFDFLRRFELGGCLADDMGLGKTVQVLALLEARRAAGAGTSLVIVPRSLVFNWLREAERFAPQLRVLDFSGVERDVSAMDANVMDVVITTYGTMRRDVIALGEREFDYVILDEAQAIKNAGTVTAKACRLLRARHRLALSGTPIENRIEELWSLFEFLNPGMLGAATRFAVAARASAASGAAVVSPESDGMLARALRPVILRRTKAMVAPELPARIEQTLEVEMEPKQRTFYDKLRRQYQTSVHERVQRDGVQKSRMHILEALLRLRQAACHPALVDKTRTAAPSAKLDALLPALQQVAAEGHKALVFSQFTSFLALVKERLDATGIVYEYLDGRTKNRQAKVDRFQSDTACPVFLISLKAGGQGLNLTSAEYVFLLDPWWNPAVEAQAIDRAHRIGQARRVIATRLVCRNTIESKILELQQSKRKLADAILSEDSGALASIGRDELELLLS